MASPLAPPASDARRRAVRNLEAGALLESFLVAAVVAILVIRAVQWVGALVGGVGFGTFIERADAADPVARAIARALQPSESMPPGPPRRRLSTRFRVWYRKLVARPGFEILPRPAR